MHIRTALVSPLLLAACASTARTPEAPFEKLRDVQVHYKAELAPQAGTIARSEPAKEAPAAMVPMAPVPAEPPTIDITCRLVRLERGLERELFPDLGVPAFGRVVPRADSEAAEGRWVRAGRADVLTSPKLQLADGGEGSLALSNQTAFVRGFGLVLAGSTLIGDPDVAVAEEGFLLLGRARLSAGGARVDLELSLKNTELVRPFGASVVHLPGTTTPVELQIPIGFAQELSTSLELGADEVLVLGGLVDREGRPYLAFVSSHASAPQAAVALPARDTTVIAAR